MTIQNTDLLLVNRGGTSYREDYNSIKQDILNDVPAATTPNLQAVTDEGATTTNDVTVADLTAVDGEFTGTVNGVAAVFTARVSGNVSNIPNNGAWNLAGSNLWTATGGTVVNPTSATAGQSGLIYASAEITTWGNNFQFPGGTAPTVPANSVIPYYVAAQDVISMGNATEAIS